MRRLFVLFLLLTLGGASLLRLQQRGDLPSKWTEERHPISILCTGLQNGVDQWGHDVRWVAGVAWMGYLLVLVCNRTTLSKLWERRKKASTSRTRQRSGWRIAFGVLAIVGALFALGASLETRQFDWLGWSVDLGSQEAFIHWVGDILFFVTAAHLALFLLIHLAVETWSRRRAQAR